MPLSGGARLGPYEILAPLGAGGMGEVYRARDPRLGREVAIKILPAEMSADRDRLSRFEQEARSASALNHPAIVTIYEIGHAADTSYIAMELVSGRTLREVLLEGAMPLRRLLGLAGQIADGLARAHEAGIVHRDLKPENVMVTRDGHVKILDFGLAKLVPHSDSDSSQLQTAIEPTRPGVVLGTVGYMSPEQASGKPLDFHSDQFSLGAILYEMAAGKRAFTRGTAAETLAAIIRDEPESLQALSARVPSALRWVIERCLAKDPHERYASTRDLARDLTHLRDHVSEVSAESSAQAISPPRRRNLAVPVLAAAALIFAALAVYALRRRPPAAPAAAPARFALEIPPGTTYAPPDVSRGFSVSPDGARFVIEAYSKGRRRLFARPLDSDEAVELEGSSDSAAHFWSPDSRFIAFFANGKLKKIPSTGGPPIEICDAPFAFVGAWNREGTILFVRLDPPGIYRVADTGGEPVRLTTPNPSSEPENHLWPEFLPDGRRFLYLTNPRSGLGRRELRVFSLDGKETRTVGHFNSRVEYAAPGYLVYVRDSALFAQPFDERRAELRGEPRLLASRVHYFFGPAHAAFSASQTGVIVYQTAAPSSRLAWYDRGGKEIGRLGEAAVIKGVRISPEGSRVAVDIGDPRIGTSDIWVFDLARRVSTRLHSDTVDEAVPVWSPDGSRLFYRSDRKGPPDVYETTLGVPGSERVFLEEPGVQQPANVSRDGRWLAYTHEIQTSVWNIRLVPVQGSRQSRAWLSTRFNQTSPHFSPDGRWIVYESNETGDPEIYGGLTEGAGDVQRISPAGGRHPRWKADGRELYYLAHGNTVVAVPIIPGPRWSAGTPASLFRVEEGIENYDVSPDGNRFLLRLPVDKTPQSPLRVILNWSSLLKTDR